MPMWKISSGRDIGEAKEEALKQALQAAMNAAKLQTPKSLLTNAIYLQDEAIELFGITIYGTPWLVFYLLRLIVI